MLNVPLFLTRYYVEGEDPFISLNDLPPEKASETKAAHCKRNGIGGFYAQDDYLPQRRQIEAWMREQFIAKGGNPVENVPVYMTLGTSPEGEFDIRGDIQKDAVSLRIPLDEVDLSAVSFTFPDSMYQFVLNDAGEIMGGERTNTPDVYRFHEIESLINAYQTDAHYIEAQVWNRHMLREFVRRRSEQRALRCEVIKEKLAAKSGPLIVGINGTYASGKTTFADGLRHDLERMGVKVQVVHYDDFHNPFASIQWTEETEIDAFYHRAFDSEKLVREVLLPLRERGCLHEDIACVDLGAGTYTNVTHFDIDEDTVVLLEGVLLFREPLIAHLDHKIYLDISFDEMLRRGRLRDVPQFGEWILEKYRTRYIPVQQRYVAEHDPMGVADVVIDQNG